MKRIETADGSVIHKSTTPTEDLRNFDAHGRFICNKDHPWSEDMDTPRGIRHENAAEVGEQEDGYPGGDIVKYECPNCGASWKAELPQ